MDNLKEEISYYISTMEADISDRHHKRGLECRFTRAGHQAGAMAVYEIVSKLSLDRQELIMNQMKNRTIDNE